jgi:hypothetical protein
LRRALRYAISAEIDEPLLLSICIDCFICLSSAGRQSQYAALQKAAGVPLTEN